MRIPAQIDINADFGQGHFPKHATPTPLSEGRIEGLENVHSRTEVLNPTVNVLQTSRINPLGFIDQRYFETDLVPGPCCRKTMANLALCCRPGAGRGEDM